MTKQKVGLVLFWTGIVWTVDWETVAVVKILPLMHSLTLDEFNQTVWALTGPLMSLRGMSMPLGAIMAGIGILLYSNTKGSTVWKVGIGLFIVLITSLVAMGLNFYSSPLFGIGGSLIFLSFIGILCALAKERRLATGSGDTTVRLWNTQQDYLLEIACQVVGRNCTRIEWKKHFPNDEYRKTCEQWSLEPEIAASATATP